MDGLWSTRRFAHWWYELPDGEQPTKAQMNSTSQRCRDGVLPAMKICGEWRIDMKELMEGARNG